MAAFIDSLIRGFAEGLCYSTPVDLLYMCGYCLWWLHRSLSGWLMISNQVAIKKLSHVLSSSARDLLAMRQTNQHGEECSGLFGSQVCRSISTGEFGLLEEWMLFFCLSSRYGDEPIMLFRKKRAHKSFRFDAILCEQRRRSSSGSETNWAWNSQVKNRRSLHQSQILMFLYDIPIIFILSLWNRICTHYPAHFSSTLDCKDWRAWCSISSVADQAQAELLQSIKPSSRSFPSQIIDTYRFTD